MNAINSNKNIGNITFQNFLDQISDEDLFNLDTISQVNDLANNRLRRNELAKEIVKEFGLSDDFIPDMAILIELQLEEKNYDTVNDFLFDIFEKLNQASGNDGILSQDEINQTLVGNAKDIITQIDEDSSIFSSESELENFLRDVLKSLTHDGQKISLTSAPLLSEFLDVDLHIAENLIIASGGDYEKVLDIISLSEELQNGDISVPIFTLDDLLVLEDNIGASVIYSMINEFTHLTKDGGFNQEVQDQLIETAQIFLGEGLAGNDEIQYLLDIVNFDNKDSLSFEEGQKFFTLLSAFKKEKNDPNSTIDTLKNFLDMIYQNQHGHPPQDSYPPYNGSPPQNNLYQQIDALISLQDPDFPYTIAELNQNGPEIITNIIQDGIDNIADLYNF